MQISSPRSVPVDITGQWEGLEPPALSPGQAPPATQLKDGSVPDRKPPIWFQLRETILKTTQSQFQALQFPAPRFRKLLSKYRRSLAAVQAALFLGCGR